MSRIGTYKETISHLPPVSKAAGATNCRACANGESLASSWSRLGAMSPVLEADRDVAIGVHVVMMVAFAIITATRAATRVPIAARAGRRERGG